MNRSMLGISCAALVVLASPCAIAADDVAAGVRAYVDPATGRLAPRPAETPASPRARAPGKSGVPMRTEILADGTRVATLDASYEQAVTLHRHADGTLHARCDHAGTSPDDAADAPSVDTSPEHRR